MGLATQHIDSTFHIDHLIPFIELEGSHGRQRHHAGIVHKYVDAPQSSAAVRAKIGMAPKSVTSSDNVATLAPLPRRLSALALQPVTCLHSINFVGLLWHQTVITSTPAPTNMLWASTLRAASVITMSISARSHTT